MSAPNVGTRRILEPAIAPTAAAATTAAINTATTTAEPAAAAALFARTGQVHGQRALAHLVGVEHANRFLSLGLRGHLDKPEALRLARVAILDHRDRCNRASLCEQRSQLFFAGRVRQITHIQLHFHFLCSPYELGPQAGN